jgi:hypothetical protein
MRLYVQECEMHVNGSTVQSNTDSLNATFAAESAVAQRAAIARKKLKEADLDIDDEPISEADFMIVSWLEETSDQSQN